MRIRRPPESPRCRTRPARLARETEERPAHRRGVGSRSSLGMSLRPVWPSGAARTAASCLSFSARTRVTIASKVWGSWIASSERLLRSRPILSKLEPVDQPAVPQAPHLGGGGKPDDEQLAKLALPRPAIAKREHPGPEQRFLGGAQQAPPAAHETLGAVKDPVLPLPGCRSIGRTHRSTRSFS